MASTMDTATVRSAKPVAEFPVNGKEEPVLQLALDTGGGIVFAVQGSGAGAERSALR